MCAFDRRGVTALVGVVEFLAVRFELSPFELANRDFPPLLTGSNQRRIHKLNTGRSPKKLATTLMRRRSSPNSP